MPACLPVSPQDFLDKLAGPIVARFKVTKPYLAWLQTRHTAGEPPHLSRNLSPFGGSFFGPTGTMALELADGSLKPARTAGSRTSGARTLQPGGAGGERSPNGVAGPPSTLSATAAAAAGGGGGRDSPTAVAGLQDSPRAFAEQVSRRSRCCQ